MEFKIPGAWSTMNENIAGEVVFEVRDHSEIDEEDEQFDTMAFMASDHAEHRGKTLKPDATERRISSHEQTLQSVPPSNGFSSAPIGTRRLKRRSVPEYKRRARDDAGRDEHLIIAVLDDEEQRMNNLLCRLRDWQERLQAATSKIVTTPRVPPPLLGVSRNNIENNNSLLSSLPAHWAQREARLRTSEVYRRTRDTLRQRREAGEQTTVVEQTKDKTESTFIAPVEAAPTADKAANEQMESKTDGLELSAVSVDDAASISPPSASDRAYSCEMESIEHELAAGDMMEAEPTIPPVQTGDQASAFPDTFSKETCGTEMAVDNDDEDATEHSPDPAADDLMEAQPTIPTEQAGEHARAFSDMGSNETRVPEIEMDNEIVPDAQEELLDDCAMTEAQHTIPSGQDGDHAAALPDAPPKETCISEIEMVDEAISDAPEGLQILSTSLGKRKSDVNQYAGRSTTSRAPRNIAPLKKNVKALQTSPEASGSNCARPPSPNKYEESQDGQADPTPARNVKCKTTEYASTPPPIFNTHHFSLTYLMDTNLPFATRVPEALSAISGLHADLETLSAKDAQELRDQHNELSAALDAADAVLEHLCTFYQLGFTAPRVHLTPGRNGKDLIDPCPEIYMRCLQRMRDGFLLSLRGRTEGKVKDRIQSMEITVSKLWKIAVEFRTAWHKLRPNQQAKIAEILAKLPAEPPRRNPNKRR